MALKDRLRSKRTKRFGNVSDDYHIKPEEMNFSSSDSEPGGFDRKNKVREEFSTKRLMKESECFTVDNDHIYTSVLPPLADGNSTTRKRKISEDSNEKLTKKRCFSKNAVMARLNRERKKKYLSSLEAENESLRKENNEMTRKLEEQNKKISVLNRDILYLKGLLSNSKELEQILRNIKEVTGLPVTSSIISCSKTGIKNESPGKSSTTEPTIEHQPRIRSVKSGHNFPILDKDINLGSCSDNSYNDMADLENYPFHFEDDLYDISTPKLNDDDFFNFNTQNLDVELEEYFQLENLSKKRDPDVGICLHVNQRRISLEICSICNSKAAASLGDPPDDMF